MISTPKKDTRSQILDIAVTLFSEKGYSGVSMRDIANATGISPPALYNHFENKLALYRAAVSAAFEDKEKRLLGAMSGDFPALERLENFVNVMTNEMHHDKRFRCLMQRELLDADEERLPFLATFIINQIQEPFMTLLDELQPGCDAFLLSELIFGLVKQHYEMQPLHPFAGDASASKRKPDDVSQLIMSMLTLFFQGES
jgi:AcrR family transcriptional regulator